MLGDARELDFGMVIFSSRDTQHYQPVYGYGDTQLVGTHAAKCCWNVGSNAHKPTRGQLVIASVCFFALFKGGTPTQHADVSQLCVLDSGVNATGITKVSA